MSVLVTLGSVDYVLPTTGEEDWGASVTAFLQALATEVESGGGGLTPNAPITPATKTKITYDANGLVTAGADATTADIASSTNKRYVTDAQLTVIGNTSGTNTGDAPLTIKDEGVTKTSACTSIDFVGGEVTATNTGGAVTVTIPTVTTVSGNAGTATALQTPRLINGVSFDGTADITVADSTKVAANGAITGATKTKITYDTKGLVTAGADATTADIADSSNKRYVTDAQLVVIGNTSGTNTGDQSITVGAFGSSPDAKAASSSGMTITMQPADATHPGAVSTTTQTLGAGTKTVDALVSTGDLTAGATKLKFISSSAFMGVNSPGYSAGPTSVTNTSGAAWVHVVNDDTTNKQPMWLDTYSGGAVALGNTGFTQRGARGTVASPAAVQNGDQIGFIGVRGYHTGGAFSAGAKGAFVVRATGTWSNTSNPTAVDIWATPSGSTTAATIITCDSTGLDVVTGTLTVGGTTALTQTNTVSSITNKSFTSPTIAAGALSGTFTGSPTFSGTPIFSNIKLGDAVPNGSNASLSLRGNINDGGSAIGVKIGNANSLTTSGAKIVSFYSDNNVTEKAYVDKDGGFAAGGPITYKGTTGITAFATGGQASATALTAECNFVTTCATNGDSVKLPTAVLGLRIVVFNLGAASLNVFPASGGAINALGTNNAFAIASGASNEFWGQSSTQWRSR